MMSVEPEKLKNLVWGILQTDADEIGCDTVFEKLDQFAELTLAGRDAAAAMPLVFRHLQNCAGCREEYEALLVALRLS
jgi:heterodisulfide reductase subunit B